MDTIYMIEYREKDSEKFVPYRCSEAPFDSEEEAKEYLEYFEGLMPDHEETLIVGYKREGVYKVGYRMEIIKGTGDGRSGPYTKYGIIIDLPKENSRNASEPCVYVQMDNGKGWYWYHPSKELKIVGTKTAKDYAVGDKVKFVNHSEVKTLRGETDVKKLKGTGVIKGIKDNDARGFPLHVYFEDSDTELFLSPNEVEKEQALKFAVGDRVRILEDTKSESGRHGNRIGDEGVVTEVQEIPDDELPYLVECNAGTELWYKSTEIEAQV